jgi:hypothetical protein
MCHKRKRLREVMQPQGLRHSLELTCAKWLQGTRLAAHSCVRPSL